MKKFRAQKLNKPRGSVEKSLIINIWEPVEGTILTHPVITQHHDLQCCWICPIATNGRRLAHVRDDELLWKVIEAAHKGTL